MTVNTPATQPNCPANAGSSSFTASQPTRVSRLVTRATSEHAKPPEHANAPPSAPIITPSRIMAVANLSPILSAFTIPQASFSPFGMKSAEFGLTQRETAAAAGSCVNAYANAFAARDIQLVSKKKPFVSSKQEKKPNA